MHKNETPCLTCELKLVDCHPNISSFYAWVKVRHPDCHISIGFRNKQDQDIAYEQGKSQKKWPESLHNNLKDNVACSLAVDLFRLDEHGQAKFEVPYYEQIWTEIKNAGLNMVWGGSWHTLKDFDHFQVTIV